MSSTDYDVFLSHNSADKPAVEELARRLIEKNINPWLDKWNLVPGDSWQNALELALDRCATCAVFIGPSGIGPWQNEEMRTAIDRRVREGRFRVIPVLLPSAQREERSRLPIFMSATTWVEFRKSLDDEEAFRRLVCGIRGIEPGPGSGEPLIEGMRPYRGLKPFKPRHAPLFFGREALTEWLINELQPSSDRKEANRFLAIIGASGSGKSSLALAGLIPALKQGAIEGSQEWPMVILRPGQDPLESLAVALSADSRVENFVPSVKGLISEFSDDPRTLHWTISKALHGASETCRTFILIDQFEEIFTLCQEDGLRTALIENMLYATSIDRGKTVAVLTMRADFYSKCAGYKTLAAALSDHQVLVGPMTEEELRQAIQRPAQLVGCELEDGLVEVLVNDFNSQPGALPLLQHALSELWEKRKDRWLTRDAYQAIGKLEGALENYANSVFEKFNENEQYVCRRIFLRLTQPGEGTEDTKRRASVQELIPADAKDEPTFRVIHDLADSRLITTEGEKDRPEDGFVEVAHEALIRGWSKLRTWIDSDRDALRIHRRLSDTASEWINAGHDESYLYRGIRLAEAEEWMRSNAQLMNPVEQEFLQKSIDLRDRKVSQEKARQKKLRRRAFVATVAAGVALLAAGFSLYAYFKAEKQSLIAIQQREMAEVERDKAERQKKIATARRLAAESNALLGKYPQRAVLLAVEAMKANEEGDLQVPASEEALRNALLVTSGYALCGHKDAVRSATISADSRWLATASADKTARLWDLTADDPSKTAVVLRGHEDEVLATVISSDSRWLVTGSRDITARLWDLTADDPSKTAVVFRGHESGVNAAAISADSRWLATASADKTTRLWDLTADDPSKTAVVLRGHEDEVLAAVISSGSRWLVTASADKTARLWDLTADDPSKTAVVLRGHERAVLAVAIGADSCWLVTASADATARLWDLTADDPSKTAVVLRGHEHWVLAAAISADSRWLVTASADTTARLWDLTADDPSKTAVVLRGHMSWSWIRIATISADSRWLVTAGADTTARLWDLTADDPSKTAVVFRGHESAVSAAAISADSRWLVTASADATARLWDLTVDDPSKTAVVFRGHESWVRDAVISVDSRWLVTASADKTARLWDLTVDDPSKTAVVLRGHEHWVLAVAIGTDSHWLVTASRDGTARLWDLTADDPSKTAVVLRGHEGWVQATAISADSRWLVTGSRDKTARLWDLTADDPSKTAVVLRGHEDEVLAAVISADSHWLVTASRDGTARLWDLTVDDPSITAVVLRGHEKLLNAAAISVDSRWLVTASADTTARLWDLTVDDPSKTAVVLRGHEGPIYVAVISTDSRWLVTAGADTDARLWDLTADDPSKTAVVLRGHEHWVYAATISADSRWLVTAGADTTARLWDLTVDDPSKTAVVLRGHENSVRAAAINADNRWLVTASDDKTARLWVLSIGELMDTAQRVTGRNLWKFEWERYFPNEPYRKTFLDFPEGF